jgi:glycine/D-amino acid oxidase-like deaminating enzyme
MNVKRHSTTIAIIGAGFCGLAVAWHLLNHLPSFPNLTVHLFDSKGIGQGASGIAAGLLHPYVGAHAKLNWRGQEGFQATVELLEIASFALKRSVTAEDPGILRLALHEEQQKNFQDCAERHSKDTQWLDATSCQALAPGCALAPGLWIKQGLTVYSSLYLQGLWQACAKRGVVFERRSIESLKEMRDFDITIVTTGAQTLELPELSSLPIKMVKGQVLELAWPKDWNPLVCPLNSQVYILMTETRSSCLVGATYEKGYQEAIINLEIAQKEILPKAFELFPPLRNGSIVNCFAGMRAVAPQHRPFIQRLSSSQWILTGMGSKGLLYHALFAKELVQSIWNEKMMA